jgi:ABC-type dipeptide/oligopeptide/nickel transport system ATPase subunit
MIISIHQPNFFPWYPFFQKMENSDIFVVLQNCQYEKNNFQNRFNLDERWYTMSVNKGLEPIVNKKYVNVVKDWSTIKKSLHQYKNILDMFDECIQENLAATNLCIIRKIHSLLNLKTQIVEDYPTELSSTERLVDLCKKYNATTYYSGNSGSSYMDLKLFEACNIKLIFQDPNTTTKQPILKTLKEKLCKN